MLSQQEIIELYSNADVFVLSSLYEPFGIVLLQAMCVKTPVIATSVGGVPEVVGDAGLLVPPANALAIAEALRRVCSDKKLAFRLTRVARERVEKNFDWKIV